MSFTFKGKSENGGGGSSSTLAVTYSGTSISAGDLIVVGVAWGAATGTISEISDGSSTLSGGNYVAGTLQQASNKSLQWYYLLSSVATGTPTYTVTYSTAQSARECHVWVYTRSGTASLDVQRADQNNPSSTAVDTGSITTTGTDELVVAGVYNGAAATISSAQINSTAADQTQTPGGNMSSWTKTFGSTFTGNGTATLNVGTGWLSNIISFKIASAGFTLVGRTVLDYGGD